jgi:hypothetical protein
MRTKIIDRANMRLWHFDMVEISMIVVGVVLVSAIALVF